LYTEQNTDQSHKKYAGAVGLEVTCPPSDPMVAGSNPGEVGRNFRMRKTWVAAPSDESLNRGPVLIPFALCIV
jgi:hypothetical protein